MMYTFKPKEDYAKANGVNLSISTKDSIIICRKIRGMYLYDAEKFLENLVNKKANLHGKYYTNATKTILDVLRSCKANAENLGLDMENLVVHASAHKGPTIKRRRRKSDFGSQMKITNIEIMLIEKPKKVQKGDNVEGKNDN